MPVLPPTASPFLKRSTLTQPQPILGSTSEPNTETDPGKLKMVYARVLKLLMPKRPYWDKEEKCWKGTLIGVYDWPILTRIQIAIRVGWSPISGTLPKALNGIGKDSKSPDAKHPGLIGSGYVEMIELDIDGLMEVNYRITPLGIQVWQNFVTARGTDELPPLRDPAKCTKSELRENLYKLHA